MCEVFEILWYELKDSSLQSSYDSHSMVKEDVSKSATQFEVQTFIFMSQIADVATISQTISFREALAIPAVNM